MPGPLRVLLVEDSVVDAALIERHLRRGGFAPEVARVETGRDMKRELSKNAWDVIICDHNMPTFSAPKALAVAKSMDLDIPFIIVSGSIDVDVAIGAMQSGAHDFLEKDNLARLIPAIEREVHEAGERRKRREAEEALRQSEQQLRHLSSQLLIAQEQERRKLAREIHDSIGQSLAAIKIRTQNVIHRIECNSPRTPETSLETILPVIQQTIDEVRRMQADLHPSILDDLGIKPAIKSLIRGFRTTCPKIKVTARLPIAEDLVPLVLRGVIFRIVQESLNNIVKHSKADSATVYLSDTGRVITLRVTDNGRGFDIEKIHAKTVTEGKLGLISMRERVQLSGGTFVILSGLGEGTEIKATWPQKLTRAQLS